MKDLKQPQRIRREDIARIANEGRERALASRAAATELTAEQTQEVSGGFPLLLPIIFGGFPFPIDLPKVPAGKTILA